MPPEDVAPQAPVAAPPVVDQAARAAKEKASADKWAAEAVKAMDEKAGKAEPEAAPAEKPRGKDGKFEKAKAKADSVAKEKANEPVKEAKAAPAPEAVPKPAAKRDDGTADKGGLPAAEESKAAPEPFSGGLGKAKRLVRQGDIAAALKLIDLDVDNIPGPQWASMRRFKAEQYAKREADIEKAHSIVEEQRAAFQREVKEQVEQLRPFAKAKDALAAGDEDAVFEMIFGKTVDVWQRERLGKMHRGDLSKDPALAGINARLEAERAERMKLQRLLEERDEQAQRREFEAKMAQNAATYRESLKERLADSGDERLARAAELPWFVKAIHEERLKHYKFDEATGTEDCISEDEAIEAVYDENRLTAAQWRQLTGEPSSHGTRDPGTLNQVATDRRANDVKRAPTRAPTSLSRSATVEAAPERRRTEKESIAYWAGKAAGFAAKGK